MATHYFRRTDPPQRRWFGWSTSKRYELWQGSGQFTVLTMKELDDLLDARHLPADFWAAIDSADAAFKEGDRESWIETGTGRRVHAPVDPTV